MPDFNAHVVLGESLTPVGQLRFTQVGPRQFSTFAYDPAWIENPRAFAVQPTFPLRPVTLLGCTRIVNAG